MRALPSTFVLILLWISAPATAQVQQFPYEAVVRADDVYVRSGPGQERYYSTGKLKQGDRVTVIRHDPGGWYVIVPPPGSFSWIQASNVNKTGPNQGTVQVPPTETGQTGGAIVRIGSQFGDDNSFYSRELSSGDVVEILGEKQIKMDRGMVLMYKIKPPVGEYRWVKGDYIVPVSEQLKQQRDRDPFATPSNARPAAEQDPFGQSTVVRERDLVRQTPAAGPQVGSTATGNVAAKLEQLDRRYADMMSLDPGQWRLDELEQSYLALRAEADPVTQTIIDKRIAALQTRRRALAEYQDFLRLTSETTQRDAQLLSLQTGRPATIMTSNPTVQFGAPQPAPQPTPAPGASGVTIGPTIEPIPDQPLPSGTQDPVTPKLDGAGIVQRVGNPYGFVQYILIAPDGRLLAYLEPAEGMNLEQYIGQSMGIIGQRSFDPRYRADKIEVRQVTPVQLLP